LKIVIVGLNIVTLSVDVRYTFALFGNAYTSYLWRFGPEKKDG
jgi:hypothetical protein